MASVDDIFNNLSAPSGPRSASALDIPSAPSQAPGTSVDDLFQKQYGLSPSPAPGQEVPSPGGEMQPPLSAADQQYKDVAEDTRTIARNIGPSAREYGRNIYEAIRHPIQTAQVFGNVAQGAGELAAQHPLAMAPFYFNPWTGPVLAENLLQRKTGLMPDTGHEEYAKAAAQHYVDRYGSLAAARKTLTTDPVGFLADLSMVVPDAEPISLAAQTLKVPAKLIAKGVQQTVGHLGTHTGPEALGIAARTGFNNPNPFGQTSASQAFLSNMRGQAPLEDTINAATSGLDTLKLAKNIQYNNNMAGIKASTRPMNFTDIDSVLNSQLGRGMFNGQVIDQAAAEMGSNLNQAVNGWRMLPQNPFHTPAGFDALKQKIGFLAKDAPNANARAMASEVYNAVRSSIIKQEPRYEQAMSAYEQAMGHIDELQRALSLPKGTWGRQPTIESSLRKLQSSLRDNVNTSFGYRRQLVEYLARNGASDLLERLAGQALQPFAARGLGRLGMQLGLEAAVMFGTHFIDAVPTALKAAGTLATMSPRLMGEAAYYGGKGLGQANAIARAIPRRTLYQSGALNRYMQQKGLEP